MTVWSGISIMTTGDGVNIVYLLLLILFVGSGLVARRMPAGQTIRYALIWIAILGTLTLLFLLFGIGLG